MSEDIVQKIQTIIVSNENHTQEVLKLYLNEYGSFNFLASTSDYQKAYSAIKELSKSFVIVDISKKTDLALDFISKVSSDFADCKILAISDKPTVDLVIKVMRAGAKEFISFPIIKNEFFNILSSIYQDLTGLNRKKNKCRVLSVFSNKGGIGKTSIASNLALELAKITKENVALVDLNFQMGDVTTIMDLKPSFNISYMLENLNKINEDFLLSTMEKYKDTSLYVLADPPYFKQAEDVSQKQISALFDVLKDTFSYIVVDTTPSFDSKAVVALDHSDMVLLVSIVNMPALRNCQRCLDVFEKLGYAKEKVQIVINRYMENDEIKIEEVEELLGREVFWKIPNNYFTLMTSINKGIPVAEVSPDSNVAKSYKELALLVSDSLYKKNLMKKAYVERH